MGEEEEISFLSGRAYVQGKALKLTSNSSSNGFVAFLRQVETNNS